MLVTSTFHVADNLGLCPLMAGALGLRDVAALPLAITLGLVPGAVAHPAQVHALQAKVAAMLLHPRRHAWNSMGLRSPSCAMLLSDTCLPWGLQCW